MLWLPDSRMGREDCFAFDAVIACGILVCTLYKRGVSKECQVMIRFQSRIADSAAPPVERRVRMILAPVYKHT